MTEIEKYLSINPYSRSGEKQGKIEYQVVHWVGNANTSAMANRNYFNNLPSINAERRAKGLKETFASSHIIIGLNGEVVRCIPNNEVAFHAGNYSMNRKSIGIEVCHPDWEGKFNEVTYNTLIKVLAENCKTYNMPVSHIIRHYDVTGKDCPHYYVKNQDEWEKLKKDVAKLLSGTQNSEIKEEKGSDEEVRTYKNGSKREVVFTNLKCTTVAGYLSPYEQCDCFGVFKNRAMVRYKIDNKDDYKIGFVKWTGGVK